MKIANYPVLDKQISLAYRYQADVFKLNILSFILIFHIIIDKNWKKDFKMCNKMMEIYYSQIEICYARNYKYLLHFKNPFLNEKDPKEINYIFR